jgi:hypothetical protein
MVMKIDEHTVDDEPDDKPGCVLKDALEAGSHGSTIYALALCR